MKKFFRRIPWVDILIAVLVSALAIGGIVMITKAAKEDKKTIFNSVFKRGALDANGLYVESDTSIYTKDLIECQGLEITPDFETTGTYQVFYYDTNKSMIGSTPVMDAHSMVAYNKGTDFPYAMYCRIVITPEVPVDDDGYVDEDYKIKFYEVASIANKYTIKVNKEQKNIGVVNYFDVGEKHSNKIFSLDDNNLVTLQEVEGYNLCEISLDELSLSGGAFAMSFGSAPGELPTVFIDENGYAVGRDNFNAEDLQYSFAVPEGATAFMVVYMPDNIPVINFSN